MSTQRKPDYVAKAPLWLSYKGAMQIFDIGETTMRKLIKQGKVEARKHGGRVKIKTSSVEAYFASLPKPSFEVSPHPAQTAGPSLVEDSH